MVDTTWNGKAILKDELEIMRK